MSPADEPSAPPRSSSDADVRAPESSGRIDRAEVHLRMLVADDAEWVARTDDEAATALAPRQGWDVEKLAAELDEGLWASDARWGWAIIVSGRPSGFALVHGLDTGDARISLRIAPHVRGRGVGREVLRQLADHHFSADDGLHRMTGRAHERNVPMQRVFNAAGFRMEARYRDSFAHPDGRYASEWGYALTRADWEAGNHRAAARGADLHGLTFDLDETVEGPHGRGLHLRVLQEGRRVIARYDGDTFADGELAGILVDDLLQYRFVHLDDEGRKETRVTGRGRARVQRREDGRLELVDNWSADTGTHGRRVLVERVEPTDE
ncbi:MAG: GNAT family protein [Nitriliruptoraceae bacterium]